MLNFIPNSFNNIKAGRQVAMVTAISLMALTLLAIGSYFQVSNLSEANAISSQAAFKANIFNKIYVNGLQMRRSEKDFFARLLPKYIDKYNTATEQAIKVSNTFKSIASNKQELDRVNHIIIGLEQSQVQFAKVVNMKEELGMTPEDGLQGELRTAVHDVEDIMKKIQAGPSKSEKLDILTVEMLMLRRHEKDFMLRGTEKYIKKFQDRIQIFNAALTLSSLAQADKEKITGKMEKYDSLFNQWAALEIETNIEAKKLSNIFADIQPFIVEYFAEFDKINTEQALHREETQKSVDQNMLYTLIAVMAVILIIAVISFIVSTNISDKIKRLSTIMGELATGDYKADIQFTEFKNEFGVMARSLMVFKKTAIENENNEVVKQENIAKERQKAQNLSKVFKEFKAQSLNRLQTVNKASHDLVETSERLSVSTDNIRVQSNQVKENVTNTSLNVSGVAAATEEMSNAVAEISDQASKSANIVDQAKSKAKETIEKITALNDSAKTVETVVKLIDEIAEQTNLLALNATIEAARAGESGRGFAVVANEVKSLAEQTSKATDEIASQIAKIQQDSQRAAFTIDEMDAIISSLSEASIGVATAAEEQSAAINEISSNVTTASDLSQESANFMEQSSKSVETAHDISDEVLNVANRMKQEINNLEDDISSFLIKVNEA